MTWTDFGRFQTRCETMKELLRSAEKVALTQVSVYIHGETGSGRRALARWIHERNPSRSSRLVVMDANDLSLSQVREGDTVLLENLHEFDVAQLSNLRRLLDSGMRLRWMATSALDAKEWMESSSIAADLAYRLCIATFRMPGLQERKEDIEPLATMFLDVCCLMNDLSSKKLTDSALQVLLQHNWAGHVAELMNAIERAALNSNGSDIHGFDLSFLREKIENKTSMVTAQTGMTLSEMEKKLIFQTLELTRQNKTRAAQILGISIRTLRNKLNCYREEVAS